MDMVTRMQIFESIRALPLHEQIVLERMLNELLMGYLVERPNELEERKDFESLALHGLSRAYSTDEPEYSLADTIEYKEGHTI
jgi:hypothetical protein